MAGSQAKVQPEGPRLGFSGCFQGLTYTFEDDRFDYGEQRFVTLGLLDGTPVSIVHTESKDHIRIISFRKATKNEQILYFKNIQD